MGTIPVMSFLSNFEYGSRGDPSSVLLIRSMRFGLTKFLTRHLLDRILMELINNLYV